MNPTSTVLGICNRTPSFLKQGIVLVSKTNAPHYSRVSYRPKPARHLTTNTQSGLSSLDGSLAPTPEASEPLKASKSTQVQQQRPFKTVTAHVSRAGTMTHCVQVTYHRQVFDTNLQKHYTRPTRFLAHDPNPAGYLREGDVIECSAWTEEEKAAREQRKIEVEQRIREEAEASGTKLKPRFVPRHKRYTKSGKRRTGNHGTGEDRWKGPKFVVRKIVTPFGTPLEDRVSAAV